MSRLYNIVLQVQYFNDYYFDDWGGMRNHRVENKVFNVFIIAENKESALFRAGYSVHEEHGYNGGFRGEVNILNISCVSKKDYDRYVVTGTVSSGNPKVWCYGGDYGNGKWERLSYVPEGTLMELVSDGAENLGYGAISLSAIEAKYRIRAEEEMREEQERQERELRKQKRLERKKKLT